MSSSQSWPWSSSPVASKRVYNSANMCEGHTLKGPPSPSPSCVWPFWNLPSSAAKNHIYFWTKSWSHHCWVHAVTLTWPPKKVTSILLDSGMEFPALNTTIAKDQQGGWDSPAEPPHNSQPGRSLHCPLGDPEPSLNSRPTELEYTCVLFERLKFVRQKKKLYRSQAIIVARWLTLSKMMPMVVIQAGIWHVAVLGLLSRVLTTLWREHFHSARLEKGLGSYPSS